jgi:hypothetical protein
MARAVAIAVAFLGVVSLGAPTASASGDALSAASLSNLDRIRSDPGVADDPREIDALAREAEGLAPGPLRTQARMIVAEAWRGRMQRPNDAVDELRKVTGDPSTDPVTGRLAERELVDALLADSKLDRAADEARANTARLDPPFVARVQRLARRQTWTLAAMADLTAYFALAFLAIAHTWRTRTWEGVVRSIRQMTPLAVGFATYVAIVGGVLAAQYETGNATPFLVLGAAVVPLVLVARAWSAASSGNLAARIGRALLCTTSVFSAAFLVLRAVRSEYLDGFGL